MTCYGKALPLPFYSTYFLTDLGDIWYMRSSGKAVEHCRVHKNWCCESHTLLKGIN